MCLYPTLMINRKYTITKKNGGNIPPITDQRTKYVPIGCQQCIECRKQRARAWQVRLLEEVRSNWRHGKFITLTFSDKYIAIFARLVQIKEKAKCKKFNLEYKPLTAYDLDNAIATIATRRFLERYRKEYGVSCKHWLVTELGHNGTENIHLHGMLWTNQDLRTIETLWKYGWVWKGKDINGMIINYVNESTVNYVTKYVTKVDQINKGFKPKVLASPGIGRAYTSRSDARRNQYSGSSTKETYTTRTGHDIALPIYYRNKIYTEQQREQLWINRLDKYERWICGEKVNIRNGEEDYYRLLKHHRQRNTALGYGNGEITWERKVYEEHRRNLMIQQRIANANAKEQKQYA